MSSANSRSAAQNGDERATGEETAHKQEAPPSRTEPSRGENEQRKANLSGIKRYRWTGGTLFVIGLMFGLLGLWVSSGTDVLFTLAGIGVFTGVLTVFMTPTRFISAEHAERMHAATAQSYEQLCDSFGLSDRRIYVPASANGENSTDSTEKEKEINAVDVRLVIPQEPHTDSTPASGLQNSTLVTDGQNNGKGLSLIPNGSGLFDTFIAVLNAPLGDNPRTLYRQLSEATVKEFEFATSSTFDIDSGEGSMSVQFSDTLYDGRSSFDHPVVSFFAVGLALGLDSPIETEITGVDPLSVVFSWNVDRPDGTNNVSETCETA